LAPEQIEGKRGDARTDVYALGIMLFEMLAGRVPWEGDNPLAVMSQHVNAPVPSLREIAPAIPPPLEPSSGSACERIPRSGTPTPASSAGTWTRGRTLTSRRFVFGEEKAPSPVAKHGLPLLVIGISAGFVLASILFVVAWYVVSHR